MRREKEEQENLGVANPDEPARRALQTEMGGIEEPWRRRRRRREAQPLFFFCLFLVLLDSADPQNINNNNNNNNNRFSSSSSNNNPNTVDFSGFIGIGIPELFVDVSKIWTSGRRSIAVQGVPCTRRPGLG